MKVLEILLHPPGGAPLTGTTPGGYNNFPNMGAVSCTLFSV